LGQFQDGGHEDDLARKLADTGNDVSGKHPKQALVSKFHHDSLIPMTDSLLTAVLLVSCSDSDRPVLPLP
jgi:hypothetical protein